MHLKATGRAVVLVITSRRRLEPHMWVHGSKPIPIPPLVYRGSTPPFPLPPLLPRMLLDSKRVHIIGMQRLWPKEFKGTHGWKMCLCAFIL